MEMTWPELHADAFAEAGLTPYVPAYVVEDYVLVMAAELEDAKRRAKEAENRPR